jgi:putative addiction module component (TIGR02574 family)
MMAGGARARRSLRALDSQALRLPPDDRERLAGAPLHSLDGAPLNEIDQAWIAEAERRYEDWRAGKSELLPGENLLSDLRRELGWD